VKKIGRADIAKTEEKLSITLPDDFVSHYLQFNGGLLRKPGGTVMKILSQ
jgi:hypothetical protein